MVILNVAKRSEEYKKVFSKFLLPWWEKVRMRGSCSDAFTLTRIKCGQALNPLPRSGGDF